jgi:hypothetical protein
MKKVLSPSSEKRMRRKPETAPSVKGLSPMTPFYGGGGGRRREGGGRGVSEGGGWKEEEHEERRASKEGDR